jgi:phosphomannomutase
MCLFDLDGTLTPARKPITQEMIETISKLKATPNVEFGIVSGSDLKKIQEQCPQDFIDGAHFCFAENGLYTTKAGQFHASSSII